MTLKTLVTGFVTAAAGAAVVAAAAGGMTSIASGAPSQAPAVQPVVWDIPMPQAPAPDLQSPLVQTLTGLAGPGSYTGAKASYIQGGLGRIESRLADSKYRDAQAKGYFPLAFAVDNIDQNGPVATAFVTATSPTGASASQAVTFVTGPSPTGWQISKDSAMALLSSVA
ncbi:hypothetical protein [Mycolicibacterium arenosum]|uniref:Low molecular weight antigen MTB12-like C-terminal domain-containing protein n=1 Tax=Mycolicibacterium arenosum TaxID=2952157 RepID=A0ABT1ME66_9MYCO|nr:hypothetical protein [Mycolicibacterium sp. CAU 1645]MCP9276072.1 hypothetical protein [Mycolicibacterium sp. CAU 1645]